MSFTPRQRCFAARRCFVTRQRARATRSSAAPQYAHDARIASMRRVLLFIAARALSII